MGELRIWLQKLSNQEEPILWLGKLPIAGLAGSTRHPEFLPGAINPLTHHTPGYARFQPEAQGFCYLYDKVGHKIAATPIKGSLGANPNLGTALLP